MIIKKRLIQADVMKSKNCGITLQAEGMSWISRGLGIESQFSNHTGCVSLQWESQLDHFFHIFSKPSLFMMQLTRADRRGGPRKVAEPQTET